MMRRCLDGVVRSGVTQLRNSQCGKTRQALNATTIHDSLVLDVSDFEQDDGFKLSKALRYEMHVRDSPPMEANEERTCWSPSSKDPADILLAGLGYRSAVDAWGRSATPHELLALVTS